MLYCRWGSKAVILAIIGKYRSLSQEPIVLPGLHFLCFRKAGQEQCWEFVVKYLFRSFDQKRWLVWRSEEARSLSNFKLEFPLYTLQCLQVSFHQCYLWYLKVRCLPWGPFRKHCDGFYNVTSDLRYVKCKSIVWNWCWARMSTVKAGFKFNFQFSCKNLFLW